MVRENKDTRKHRIKADYGVNEYYRQYAKDNKSDKVSRSIYGSILKEFNDFQREKLSFKGVGIHLPCFMGRVELRKVKTEVKIDDKGNVINNLPVNWKETRKLWKENNEAYQKRIKIKFTNEHTDSHTFRINYLKGKAKYKNKSIYRIRFNRKLKRDLSTSIFEGRIDAFLQRY